MKPVESGCPEAGSARGHRGNGLGLPLSATRPVGRQIPADALQLLEASGSGDPLELVNPYAFEAPLAPALAAEREGVEVDLAHIGHCYAELAARHPLMIVEGAGGLLTPLTGELTMRELAAALGLPILIVARNALGTINHAALTVEAARSAGPVLGIVLNHLTPEGDESAASNPASLQRWAGAPLLGTL